MIEYGRAELDWVSALCFDGGIDLGVVAYGAMLKKQTVSRQEPESQPEGWAGRLADIALMIAVLLLSALAVAAVAFVAPLILAVSAIAGLMTKNRAAKSWRPAGA